LGTNLVDGVQIGTLPAVANAVSDAISAVDDTVPFAGDDADNVDELDGEEIPEEQEASEQVERSYLPLINR
jgi:hypothetical protein